MVSTFTQKCLLLLLSCCWQVCLNSKVQVFKASYDCPAWRAGCESVPTRDLCFLPKRGVFCLELQTNVIMKACPVLTVAVMRM